MIRFPFKENCSTRNILLLKKTEEKWQSFFTHLRLVMLWSIHSDYSSADDRDLTSSVRHMGVVPLLALLENSLLKPSLFHLLIQHLCQLFIKVDDLCLQAVDHGLLETLCNVIYGLCTLQHKQR